MSCLTIQLLLMIFCLATGRPQKYLRYTITIILIFETMHIEQQLLYMHGSEHVPHLKMWCASMYTCTMSTSEALYMALE